MAWRNVVTIVTGITISCSSALFAADSGSLEKSRVSTVEISSTSLKQSRPEASCELKVKERYEYYDIDGSTVPELKKQMKHNGTRWGDGRTYAAVTTWDLHFDYDTTEDDGRCSVKSAQTRVDIVYHLPRWTPAASAASLAPEWGNYITHLKTHEFGHKDIAVKIAAEINEVLASLQNFRNQTALEREAKRLTDEKLRALNDLQVEYDARTRHGETQGAVFEDHASSKTVLVTTK